MREATLRCKQFLHATLGSREALGEKRIRACAQLEVLLEQIAETLPQEERRALKEVLQLYAQLWS